MAIGEHYEVKTVFSYLGVVAMNRYYYSQISTDDPTTEDLANAWIEDVYPSVKAIQSSEAALVQVVCINLDNPVDFYETAVTGAVGDRSANGSPPFTSWTYTLFRNDRTFRPGRKAYVGVAEDDIQNGQPVAGIVAALDAVADALGANIAPTGFPGVFRPRLLRYVPGVGVVDSCGITGAAFRAVSTQNTRKFGRGI